MHCSAKQSSRIFSASHTCVFVSKETCCCSRFNQKCLEFSPWRNYFELDLDPTLEIFLSKDYFLISRFLLVVRFIFLYFTFTIESTRHKSIEEGFAIPMTKRKLTFIDQEKTRRPFFHSRTNTTCSHESASIDTELVNRREEPKNSSIQTTIRSLKSAPIQPGQLANEILVWPRSLLTIVSTDSFASNPFVTKPR